MNLSELRTEKGPVPGNIWRFSREVLDPEQMAHASPGWQQQHIVTQRGRYHVRLEAAQTPRLQLATSEVTLGRIVRGSNPSGTLTFGIPIWAVGEVRSRGRALDVLDLASSLAGEEMDLEYEGATKQIVLTVSQRFFERRVLLSWQRELRTRAFSFVSPAARSEFLARTLHLLSHAETIDGLERQAIDELLVATAPQEKPRTQSWRKKIALEARRHICEHLYDDVSMGDLAEATGASLRTLQYAFRETYGLAPAEFARRERLLRARSDLQQATADTSVAEIAMRYGFYHLGRFAQTYRRTFGEKPSETFKARRFLGLS